MLVLIHDTLWSASIKTKTLEKRTWMSSRPSLRRTRALRKFFVRKVDAHFGCPWMQECQIIHEFFLVGNDKEIMDSINFQVTIHENFMTN